MSEQNIDYTKSNSVLSYNVEHRDNESVAVKKLQVGEHYSDLQMQLSKLEETIRQLGGRLTPILTPSGACAERMGDKPTPSMSEMAHSIYKDVERVKEFQSLVNDILARLEI